MTELPSATLEHLAALVSFDTRNPPRAIAVEDGIFGYLRAQLPGFTVEVVDHGAGAVSLFAVRGKPKFLFNVHLDTVPDSPHWSADPHLLRVTDDRAIGLGACDIKGAAAGLLAAANATTGDAAFLFTTDEEANDPRCIAAFLARDHGFRDVIVGEPTRGAAVLAHRGISAVRMEFKGVAGHASGAQAMQASALHQAIRWGAQALDLVQAQVAETFGGLQGLRFNIGRVEGGIKANIIAPQAEVRFGFRPLPSQDMDALHARFRSFADDGSDYAETFRGPSLPAGDASAAESRRRAAQAFAESLQLPVGPAVDFWTEASLFSQAGMNAIVYGPGDIAQAHTADEWVSLQQLSEAATHYQRLMS
ncbi:acetylornithine deacetylase [Solilutibacter silvestris]|uniref:N-acetyl-L-citrulline deacetylase n=1 Tax=Solilutibacter silvestris TaxID=1645665 RepID=A0A2K1Q3I9_9GAMM|nr:acetylornithine deacetylase [Lysobacter silvestris]PNS09615.1 Acetylornithine deacetylase/Succinyl-diaminopimelate desuccinylase [Lysobacter silvestris]